MGRPLNKKYFGTAEGIGGESLLSVAVLGDGGNAGSLYSQGLTATVALPGLPGGVRATITVAVNPTGGAITGYSVVNGGSGYISAPAVTLVQPTAATAVVASPDSTTANILVTTASITNTIYVGMTFGGQRVTGVTPGSPNTTVTMAAGVAVLNGVTITFAVPGSGGVAGTRTLTDTNPPALKITAFLTGGSAKESDVIKQTGTDSYQVINADGTGVVTLVASDTLTAGQASITATDANSSTYYVTKLTAHRAVLMQNDMGSSFEYPDGASIAWDFVAPVPEVVRISST
jgi:hypothetical protein